LNLLIFLNKKLTAFILGVRINIAWTVRNWNNRALGKARTRIAWNCNWDNAATKMNIKLYLIMFSRCTQVVELFHFDKVVWLDMGEQGLEPELRCIHIPSMAIITVYISALIIYELSSP
jgi:hypothetical protein